MGYKQCSLCNETKPLKEFTGKTRYKTKAGEERCTTSPYCRACLKVFRDRWKEKNPAWWIKQRYKISIEEATYWYEKSMESCEICGYKWIEGDDRLCIDHDHSTEKVRGVLCKHCNYVLGHSREDKTILEKTIKYIKKHKEN